MSEKLSFTIERAKLRANLWNGLAIATIAIGALPFLIGVTDPEPSSASPWLDLLRYSAAIFLAVSLGRFFHTLAIREIAKVSE